MMVARWAVIGAMALVMTGCGGGGSSSNPPTGGGGTPTPTASPSPTPTPTPITYTAFADLTGDQDFSSSCVSRRRTGLSAGIVGPTAFGTDATIAVREADESYRFVFDGVGATFLPGDRRENAPEENIAFQIIDNEGRSTSLSIFPPQISGERADYVRFLNFNGRDGADNLVEIHCITGVPTELADSRPSGPVTALDLGVVGSALVQPSNEPGTRTMNLGPSVISLTADAATGEISGTIDLKGRRMVNGMTEVLDLETYTFVAMIDGTEQTFKGQIGDSQNTQVGEFAGWFFGPQGIEVGFAFTISDMTPDGTGVEAIGAAAGGRASAQ